MKPRVAFNMKWLMEILKIYMDEQLLTKKYVIKHLILLKNRNMIDSMGTVYKVLDEESFCGAIKSEIVSN